jgi:hypothetical protein
MTFDNQTIDQIRDLSATARRRAEELKREAEESGKIEQEWAKLLEFTQKGWPAHILGLLEEKTAQLKRLRIDAFDIEGVINRIAQTAKEDLEIQRRRFPNLLEQACREEGLEIHRDSRHPRYYFNEKFFTLEINDQKKTARVSNHEGRLEGLPFDIGAIIEAIKRQQERLFNRKFNSKAFLKKLRRHYLAIIKKEKLDDGHSVPIRAITGRLGKNEKGFRSDEFLVDLSRLIEQGSLEIDERRLDLQQTKDTKQGMLLYGQTSQGYIGFVVFRKEEL